MVHATDSWFYRILGESDWPVLHELLHGAVLVAADLDERRPEVIDIQEQAVHRSGAIENNEQKGKKNKIVKLKLNGNMGI